jgi:hypothetical protein
MTRNERGRRLHQRAAPEDKTATRLSVNVKGKRPAAVRTCAVNGDKFVLHPMGGAA